MWTQCPAHARRSRAGRKERARRSPVLSSRRRLDLVLFLLLGLHVPLLTRRTAEQLFGLLLSEPALWLWGLTLRRLVVLSTAAGAPAPPPAAPPAPPPAATLLLAKRELVVPLRIEIARPHLQRFLVDRERGVQLA